MKNVREAEVCPLLDHVMVIGLSIIKTGSSSAAGSRVAIRLSEKSKTLILGKSTWRPRLRLHRTPFVEPFGTDRNWYRKQQPAAT